MKEEWRGVVGYEGYYQVSSLGRMRSLNRVIIQSNGVKIFCLGKYLSPCHDSCGYPRIVLSGKQFSVHRLMGYAFLGLTDDMQINHINGIKDDNRLENLEIVTHQENISHSWRVGLHSDRAGDNANRRILKEVDVLRIKWLLNNGIGYREVAEKYPDVSCHAIHKISKNKNWSTVGEYFS